MLRKNSNMRPIHANTAAYMINHKGMCTLLYTVQLHISNDK